MVAIEDAPEGTQMNLTFKIADREAIPARAIPFVAGTDTRTLLPRIQPSLIWQSARLAANAWSPGIPALHLYLIQDGEPVRATLAFLDAVANETEFLPEFDYPIRDSARRLPAELFVFADELQRFVGWLFPAGTDEGLCADAPQLDLSLQLPSGALGTGGVLDSLFPTEPCLPIKPAYDVSTQPPKTDVAAPSGSEKRHPSSKNIALFMKLEALKVPMNIESIWLHFRDHRDPDRDNYICKTISDNEATLFDGHKIIKNNLRRSLMRYVKRPRT